MRRTGSGWDRSFFLAVRKRRPRHPLLPEEGGGAGESSTFDAFVPFFLAAFPAAFFIACGQPNQERSSPPLLTVLLLLTGEHLEEVGGGKNERDGTSGVWALQRSFLPLGRGNLGVFPRLTERVCSPTISAKLN